MHGAKYRAMLKNKELFETAKEMKLGQRFIFSQDNAKYTVKERYREVQIKLQVIAFSCAKMNLNFSLIFFSFSLQVAQYIKFEIPVLDSFVEKLKEEEEREIVKLTKK